MFSKINIREEKYMPVEYIIITVYVFNKGLGKKKLRKRGFKLDLSEVRLYHLPKQPLKIPL